MVLREPGGVEVSERIRELLKDPELTIDPRAEALLYAAARAQLVATSCGRCWSPGRRSCSTASSTRRSPTRAPGAASGSRRSAPSTRSGPAGSRPTARCCCGSTPRAGLGRIAGRPPDRLEREDVAFFETIAAAYDALAAADPDRFAVIDAGQPPESVLADALAAL